MKTAFRAKTNRQFRIRFAWLIGFGYERSLLNLKGQVITEIVSFYLPFCVISAVQQFERVTQ